MADNFHTPLILQPPPDFQTQFPHIVSLSRRLSMLYVHRHAVADRDLRTVGAALRQTLAADEALAEARQAAGTKTLPLIIESADPLVQSL